MDDGPGDEEAVRSLEGVVLHLLAHQQAGVTVRFNNKGTSGALLIDK